MSWVERLRERLAPPCDRCGGPVIVEREQLLTMSPTVFEIVAWCPTCAEPSSRCRVVDCLQ